MSERRLLRLTALLAPDLRTPSGHLRYANPYADDGGTDEPESEPGLFDRCAADADMLQEPHK